jgi:hypothetical protein
MKDERKRKGRRIMTDNGNRNIFVTEKIKQKNKVIK